MTATFKTLLALIFVLAQGPIRPRRQLSRQRSGLGPAPVKDRLAWQRVGSPLQQA